jgi:streptogramin lyase
VTATEFSEGFSRDARPLDIAAGPDGNLWFTDPGANAIGRITPQGQITEFSQGLSTWIPTAPGPYGPLAIAAGPDGNLWFTEPYRALIGRITPLGEITEFSQGLSPGSYPVWIAAGPDGNLWFTASEQGGVGRITPNGEITELVGTPRPSAGGITAGPDGNVWFTDDAVSIGRVTPAAEVTVFSDVLDPFDITAGPDGNLWFTEGLGGIGRITPDGEITEFREGISSTPRSITAGPDGNLWFTEPFLGLIARITPGGKVTEFCHGISPSATGLQLAPAELAAGPDGNLWFTDPNAPRIGRLSIESPADAADLRPTSNVVRPPVKLRLFKRPIHLFGRACDDRRVARLDISLTRPQPSGRRRRCQALSRGGRWLRYRRTGRRCKPRFLLRSKPEPYWRMHLPRTLPKGHYMITSRATDSAGQRESRFSAKRGNLRRLDVGF